jgi:hypothetical protein
VLVLNIRLFVYLLAFPCESKYRQICFIVQHRWQHDTLPPSFSNSRVVRTIVYVIIYQFADTELRRLWTGGSKAAVLHLGTLAIHSLSSLSYDRSKASCPQSAI